MARIVKKKKRKLSFRGFAVLLFSFSLFALLVSSLLINTINASLTMKIQKMNDELASIRTENQTLNYEIQSLENKDRVYEIASTANMAQVQDNIISLIGE